MAATGLPVPSGPAIAKLMDSGYGKQENELPIDINYQKLAEWLVTRKRMPPDWHKRVAAIQAKAAEAAKGLPPGLLAELPGGADAPLDYSRAVAVRDKLAESGERTLFGGLAGAAGVWDTIVKAYEKQNVFMGEAASSLVAAVDYELPYLRKQSTRYGQLISDADRKGGEYVKAAAAAAANYKAECARLGIQGADARAELAQLGRQLPGRFQSIVEELRAPLLGEAAAYYAAFVAYAHTPPGAAAAPALLPTLTEVRDGTTAPPAARGGGGGAAAPAAGGGGIEIDWDAALSGGGGDTAAASGGEAEGGGGGGIDWDLDLSELAAAAAAGGGDDARGGSGEAEGGGGPAISWDIELTEAAAEDGGAAAAPAPAAAPAAAAEDEDAAGAEAAALRLGADAEYRASLLDDLQELRAFLRQRAAELGGGGGGGGSDLLSALLPPAVAAVDGRGAGRLLAGVEGALGALGDGGLRQLLLIAGSGRYVERLARELARKAGQEAKLLAAAAEVEARRHESRAALAGMGPKAAAVAERTRTAQRAVEGALSAQLGRRVNVLGEINNALAAAAAGAAKQP
ncbi:MAG: hypothetical protein J3K34DRAFT_460987 [Monoraphidium minutum]|nr:MAG: hypothetical protein J3K34DRAFT_460987 [Monoraphidium minutum]